MGTKKANKIEGIWDLVKAVTLHGADIEELPFLIIGPTPDQATIEMLATKHRAANADLLGIDTNAQFAAYCAVDNKFAWIEPFNASTVGTYYGAKTK